MKTTRASAVIYLDSASLDDARRAQRFGFVSGITTNPALMAVHSRPALEQLADLLASFSHGPVFFQVEDLECEPALAQAQRAHELDPERVVLKLPAVLEQFRLGVLLARRRIRFAMTAVYTPAQAVLAAQVGADWVIAYVDRARRLQPDGEHLVSRLAGALGVTRKRPRLIAASVKTSAQAMEALRDGADALTLPLAVIERLAQDDLTDQAVREFADVARRP